MTILFLCSGNMHRSPLAAAMLRASLRREGRSDVHVASAGTCALEGAPAVSEARDLAAEDGFDLSEHRSRPAASEEIARTDMILALGSEHRDWVADHCPVALPRCRLLSEFAPIGSPIRPGEDVPDAVEGVVTWRESYEAIRACVRGVAASLPPAPHETYARAVEERFREMRRTPLALSPVDWQQIDRWWRLGVPLWIVLESLDDLFRKKEASGDPSRVRRLSWCDREVMERFEAFRAARVTAGESPPTDAASPCQEAARRLREAEARARASGQPAAADLFASASSEAGRIDPASSGSAQIGRLHALEEDLLRSLRQVAPAARVSEAERLAEERLAPHRDRMTPEAYAATRERLLDETVRAIFEVPSLIQP